MRYLVQGRRVVSLDLRTVYLKHIELIGSTLGTHQEFADPVISIEGGPLKPLLAKTCRLENLKTARETFAQKEFVGKLVIIP